jgi:hypothetical protein
MGAKHIALVKAVAAPSASTLTLIQVAASANTRLEVIGWEVSFDGADSTKTPILCELLRQTTAGTSTALTLAKGDEASQTATATAGKIFTAEPTAGDILDSKYLTPANGIWGYQWPLGDEIVVGVSGRIGIRVITVAGSGTPNLTARLVTRDA